MDEIQGYGKIFSYIYILVELTLKIYISGCYLSQPEVINEVFSLNTHYLVDYKLKFLATTQAVAND